MPFAPRSRATIRDSILSNLASRYATAGARIDTAEGSDAWFLASAYAVELEALEAQADAQSRELLPDTASASYLDRHGAVEGVAREAAVATTVRCTVTGTAGATITFGSATLLSTAGLVYAPTTLSVALDGSGNGTVDFACRTAGAVGNLAASTTLTWSSTPTNANPTATVASTVTTGTDEETDAAYAARLIARRQERPASGNRADWRHWVEAYDGVEEAYVYPLLQPPAAYPGAGTANVLGCVTVLAVGPAQGDGTTNKRIVGGSAGASLASTVGAFVEGTKDRTGAAVPATLQKQLRPATMAAGDYSIEAIQVSSQNVDIRITNASAYAFPWSGTMTVDAASTTTSLVVNGDQRAQNGKAALIFVGTSAKRGGFEMRTLPTGTYDGGTNKTTFSFASSALAGTPSGTVYPAPPNWPSIRDALFALFDALGPGDTSPAARWPTEDVRGRATLYVTALIEAVRGVAGVLDVSVVTPAASVVPAAKTVVTLGTMTIRTL